MLIHAVTDAFVSQWLGLAREMEPIFGAAMVGEPGFRGFMGRKIAGKEAFMALDRMRGYALMGVIAFSKKKNRISWFGVFETYRRQGVGSALLACALNQLDKRQEIEVTTFRDGSRAGAGARRTFQKQGFQEVDDTVFHHDQPRCVMKRPADTVQTQGQSFHFQYQRYMDWAVEETCPVCCDEPETPGYVLIKELEHSWVGASVEAQGRLWGKCSVLSKTHAVELFDLSRQDLLNFMTDLQIASKVLKHVTGAVKINYELHGNTVPHLHAHLFPRYIDDPFPSGPIDYRITEPSAYSGEAEFDWFVSAMRRELGT